MGCTFVACRAMVRKHLEVFFKTKKFKGWFDAIVSGKKAVFNVCTASEELLE